MQNRSSSNRRFLVFCAYPGSFFFLFSSHAGWIRLTQCREGRSKIYRRSPALACLKSDRLVFQSKSAASVLRPSRFLHAARSTTTQHKPEVYVLSMYRLADAANCMLSKAPTYPVVSATPKLPKRAPLVRVFSMFTTASINTQL